MALAKLYYISEFATLALWKIEETVDDLIRILKPDKKSIEIVENFHLDKRKKEWLCVRILVKEIFGKNVEVKYQENGKPYLSDEPYSISISHSMDFVGVIVSKNKNVGIDIENISPRIEKIKSKFLSNNELNDIPDGMNYLRQLLLYWCAKETLMKIYGTKEIDFKKQLKIYPFIYTSSGSVIGEIYDRRIVLRIDLLFFEFDNSMVVYGIDS